MRGSVKDNFIIIVKMQRRERQKKKEEKIMNKIMGDLAKDRLIIIEQIKREIRGNVGGIP